MRRFWVKGACTTLALGVLTIAVRASYASDVKNGDPSKYGQIIGGIAPDGTFVQAAITDAGSLQVTVTGTASTPTAVVGADGGLVQNEVWGVARNGNPRALISTDGGALRVANAPQSPNTPVIYPDGGAISVSANTSACAYIGAGRSFELDCRTGACDCRRVLQNTDGGWPAFPDGGWALPIDTPLPADTPRLEDLPTYWDSVCCFFEAAGTLCPSPLAQ